MISVEGKKRLNSSAVKAKPFTLSVNFTLTTINFLLIIYLPNRQILLEFRIGKTTYKNKRIAKVCTCFEEAMKQYNRDMAIKIHHRVDQIIVADTVELMIEHRIGRCHPLTGNRKGQYALDLVHPFRLIFEKHGKQIQIAHIVEITDYH